MFELAVKSGFSAAHRLRGYRGKCASLHGHNWSVEVIMQAETLDKAGMVTDARRVKKIVRNFLEKNLDHTYLNELPFFKENNPTSENIARFIYQGLKKSLPRIAEVRVSESDSVAARFARPSSA